MTKEKFAGQLAKEMRAAGKKMNIEAAEKFLSLLSETMVEGLSRDRKLIISNFGSFEVTTYGAKMINSPRGDNKKFFMPPTEVIKWHPSGKIRERAGSSEVSAEEYQKLKGKPVEEFEPEVVFAEVEDQITEKKLKVDPYEVKIRYVKKPVSHLTDDRSPLAKLVKSILKTMVTENAEKLEIRPERQNLVITYSTGQDIKGEKKIPRDSHQIIINKIISLSGGTNKLLLFGNYPVELTKGLTPYGELLTISKI